MAKPYPTKGEKGIGLLSSKIELWQSLPRVAVIAEGVCYHRKLNYGKAYEVTGAAEPPVCYHRKLNYGKAADTED